MRTLPSSPYHPRVNFKDNIAIAREHVDALHHQDKVRLFDVLFQYREGLAFKFLKTWCVEVEGIALPQTFEKKPTLVGKNYTYKPIRSTTPAEDMRECLLKKFAEGYCDENYILSLILCLCMNDNGQTHNSGYQTKATQLIYEECKEVIDRYKATYSQNACILDDAETSGRCYDGTSGAPGDLLIAMIDLLPSYSLNFFHGICILATKTDGSVRPYPKLPNGWGHLNNSRFASELKSMNQFYQKLNVTFELLAPEFEEMMRGYPMKKAFGDPPFDETRRKRQAEADYNQFKYRRIFEGVVRNRYDLPNEECARSFESKQELDANESLSGREEHATNEKYVTHYIVNGCRIFLLKKAIVVETKDLHQYSAPFDSFEASTICSNGPQIQPADLIVLLRMILETLDEKLQNGESSQHSTALETVTTHLRKAHFDLDKESCSFTAELILKAGLFDSKIPVIFQLPLTYKANPDDVLHQRLSRLEARVDAYSTVALAVA